LHFFVTYQISILENFETRLDDELKIRQQHVVHTAKYNAYVDSKREFLICLNS